MFDLFRSRTKAIRYLLGALLLLVALSMVITLIPGFGSGGAGSEQIIAEIGKDVLTAREVQLNIQAALRSKTIPPDMAQHYVPDYVNRMITERAVAYQAARMGFEVTEAELALSIQSMMPQLFQDGKFAGREAYAAFLAQQNLSIPEFESNVRKQMLLNRLRNIVLEGVVVTPLEVEREYRRRSEKIKIDYVVYTADRLRSQVQVSPAELRAFFDQRRTSYRIPEKRGFQMVVIDEARVSAKYSISDAELRRAYEENKERYRTPERVHVRHILLKTTGKPKEEIAKLKTRAEGLLKQLKGGADFAELARKNSEDPGSAVKGGDLDWVARGQTVKNFEDAAFSLRPKELSGVITTEYGFHILQVLEKQPGRLKPFEEVKAELSAEFGKQAVYDRMQTIADQVRAALVANPSEAAALAQKFGVGLVKVDRAGQGDPIPEVGVRPEFWDAVAVLDKNQVTQVIPLAGDKLVVALLTDIFPSRQAEFDEVVAQVREQVMAVKADRAIEERYKEAASKLASLGGDLKKLAQATGGEFKSPPEVGRDGAVEGLGAATYISDAFDKPVGAIVGPVRAPAGAFVAKITAKTAADMSKLPAEREAILLQLKRKKATERNDLFEDGLLVQLIRQGKVKIHEDAIKRLVASYRG